MDLTRRQTLFGLSALAGHALFPDVLESFAQLPHEASPDTWTPELVSVAQGAVLAEVAETIVPKTSTPGAEDARVHIFVDSALKRCATADQQRAAVAALEHERPQPRFGQFLGGPAAADSGAHDDGIEVGRHIAHAFCPGFRSVQPRYSPGTAT